MEQTHILKDGHGQRQILPLKIILVEMAVEITQAALEMVAVEHLQMQHLKEMQLEHMQFN